MKKPITQERLDELCKSVPRATLADVTAFDEGAGPEIRSQASAYLKHFCAPNDGHKCIVCDEPLRWSFQWGLVHGQGFCSGCGWPATAYHFVREADKDILVIRGAVLQVHPGDIEIRK